MFLLRYHMCLQFINLQSVSKFQQLPLSFIVFVPGWEESPMMLKLKNSKFLKAEWIVAREVCLLSIFVWF